MDDLRQLAHELGQELLRRLGVGRLVPRGRELLLQALLGGLQPPDPSVQLRYGEREDDEAECGERSESEGDDHGHTPSNGATIMPVRTAT